MTEKELSETAFSWFLQHYDALAAFGTAITLAMAAIWLYRRVGSLTFLKDLIWRVFGSQANFESPNFEARRKNQRELEHFRYEFNIPVTSIRQADLAEQWITEKNLSTWDVSAAKGLIDWGDYTAIALKDGSLSRWTINAFKTLFAVCSLATLSLLMLISSEYLMVSFKHDPDAPSIFLAQDHVKLSLFSTQRMVLTDCRSPAELHRFSSPEMPEKRLDVVCSFLIDKAYSRFVHEKLIEQRMLLGLLLLWVLTGVISSLWRLSRIRAGLRLKGQLAATVA